MKKVISALLLILMLGGCGRTEPLKLVSVDMAEKGKNPEESGSVLLLPDPSTITLQVSGARAVFCRVSGGSFDAGKRDLPLEERSPRRWVLDWEPPVDRTTVVFYAEPLPTSRVPANVPVLKESGKTLAEISRAAVRRYFPPGYSEFDYDGDGYPDKLLGPSKEFGAGPVSVVGREERVLLSLDSAKYDRVAKLPGSLHRAYPFRAGDFWYLAYENGSLGKRRLFAVFHVGPAPMVGWNRRGSFIEVSDVSIDGSTITTELALDDVPGRTLVSKHQVDSDRITVKSVTWKSTGETLRKPALGSDLVRAALQTATLDSYGPPESQASNQPQCISELRSYFAEEVKAREFFTVVHAHLNYDYGLPEITFLENGRFKAVWKGLESTVTATGRASFQGGTITELVFEKWDVTTV